jgi:hypothetical protein
MKGRVYVTADAAAQANYPLKNILRDVQKADDVSTKSPTPRMTLANGYRHSNWIIRNGWNTSTKSHYFTPDLWENHSLVLTLHDSSETSLSSRYFIKRIRNGVSTLVPYISSDTRAKFLLHHISHGIRSQNRNRCFDRFVAFNFPRQTEPFITSLVTERPDPVGVLGPEGRRPLRFQDVSSRDRVSNISVVYTEIGAWVCIALAWFTPRL